MQPRRTLYKSISNDPWVNLALEEYFMRQLRPNEILFYLWQNDNTVVIGRNQNAWKECRYHELESEGGKLARRQSGGGAVYHDLGNLNFSFILPQDQYNLRKQLSVILLALNKLGISADFSGRNDLLVKGLKFSGNSYYFHKDIALHHGTLLINTDFSKLSRYLQVSAEKISSKGIDSVQARVINLSEIDKSLNVNLVAQNLEESFRQIYGEIDQQYTVGRNDYDIDAIISKYASWEWRFGKSPAFDIDFYRRFDWGEVDIGFTLKGGNIKEANIFSDALEERLIRDIGQNIQGSSFNKAELIQRIKMAGRLREDQQIISDIVGLLAESTF